MFSGMPAACSCIVAGVPLIALGILAWSARGAASRENVAALVATALAWTVISRRGGRDLRLAMGRPDRRAQPDHRRAAALSRAHAVARAWGAPAAARDVSHRACRGRPGGPASGRAVRDPGGGAQRRLTHPALAPPRGDVLGRASGRIRIRPSASLSPQPSSCPGGHGSSSPDSLQRPSHRARSSRRARSNGCRAPTAPGCSPRPNLAGSTRSPTGP